MTVNPFESAKAIVYFIYGFRGEDEVFAFLHDNQPDNNLAGIVNARKANGWEVLWRRHFD
mgnify:CR=1 FL=1